MKLYPPYIEGKLPAFVRKTNDTKITIPFQLNPLVGSGDFNRMILLLKTISGKQVRGTIATQAYYFLETETGEKRMGFADFSIPEEDDKWVEEIQVGQYYKAQIAFSNTKDDVTYETGYYSSVGIIKCIEQPQCQIQNLTDNEIKANPFTFIGQYSYTSTEDNEKLYSCRFDVYDAEHNLYDTSGEIIHNTEKTDGTDIWELNKNLQSDELYYIQYSYLTQNNYEGTTPKYPIIEGLYKAAGNYYNNFRLDIRDSFNTIQASGKIIVEVSTKGYVTGTYKIVRSSSEDNYNDWIDVFDFSVANQEIKTPIIWEDYFLKHGVKYKYALQRYNSKGLRLQRGCESEKILANFEDMFLYDGECQLRIAFNPKVSSFKVTTLETKTDTLGGQYPFFYRNGDVAYKDFPISGLISIHMDENFEFFDQKKLKQLLNPEDERFSRTRSDIPNSKITIPAKTTALTTDMIYLEEAFREEVLSWLNNGQPKLFRSPTEGNLLVRLMNISLSPNDTLGRMLYTFNANAYEVGKSDLRSLLKNNLFKTEQKQFNIEQHENTLLTQTVTSFGENSFFTNSNCLEFVVKNAKEPKLEYVSIIDGVETKSLLIPVKATYGHYKWKDVP